ncbi:tyrosine-type recombinase/integrase [Thermomonospora amylolytica]|uniref:tyrosine-type recombinase/integrase n=1 Tax=Thermomonospora amylolytica TaxID=1411117 RepID=UPI000E6BCF0E|nr:tyrosine-type recombinase/integrase [Thermomonospora amylolytica]
MAARRFAARGPAPAPHAPGGVAGGLWRRRCAPPLLIGPKGGPLRRSGVRRTWNKVRAEVGLPDLHFHDLRHVGNTLAATTGASLKELMARMGHSSTRAALIYLHASQGVGRDHRRCAGGRLQGGSGGRGTARAAIGHARARKRGNP